MENKVLSIERMLHLQELGLDISKASMCWLKMGEDTTLSVHNEYCYESSLMNPIPTFTLQDILEMLPYKVVTGYLSIGRKSSSGDILFYMDYIGHVRFSSISLLTAAYEMLCWCIENGYMSCTR